MQGRTVTDVFCSFSYHTCVILDNGSVKCWGPNQYGNLGIGSTTSFGDNANEMGDNLPVVNLGTVCMYVDWYVWL
jgi:hypothetical protein